MHPLIRLYLEGLAFGVIPVFFVGPVFFTLVHASLREGFRAGAWVAAGIAFSDVVAVALSAAGVGALLTTSWGRLALGIAGGLLLMGFGVALALAKAPSDDVQKPLSSERAQPARSASEPGNSAPWKLFGAGFVVNFVNPFVFAFWVGAIGGVSSRHGFSASTVAAFFAGSITTIFVTDVAKAKLAATLRERLSRRALLVGQRLAGALLGLGGLYVLWRTTL